METERELLRRLEERLLQPEVRRSARDLDELLADEFVEFGGSGRVFGKREIIETLRDEPAIQRTLTDSRRARWRPASSW